jgi:hypothetical protein
MRRHFKDLFSDQGYEWFRATSPAPGLHLFSPPVLSAEKQRVLLAYHYMLPMHLRPGRKCPQCECVFEEDNLREILHHVVSQCKAQNQKTYLHNGLRDIVYSYALTAGMLVDREKAFVLGPKDLRRPDDVLFKRLGHDHIPTALDLTVVLPRSLKKAESEKFRALGFKDPEFLVPKDGGLAPLVPLTDPEGEFPELRFAPAAFDYLGRVGPWAKWILNEIAQALATSCSVTVEEAYTHLRRYLSQYIAYNLATRINACLNSRPLPSMRGAWQKILKAARITARKRDRKYAKPALQSPPEVVPEVTSSPVTDPSVVADVADVVVSDVPVPDPTPAPAPPAPAPCPPVPSPLLPAPRP